MRDGKSLALARGALAFELAIYLLEVGRDRIGRRRRARDPAVPPAYAPQDVGIHPRLFGRRLMRILPAAGHPHRGRRRERLDGDVLELVVLALERLLRRLQQLHRRLEHFVRAPAPLLDRAAGRLELGRVPASADSVDETAAGEVLQRRDLLGEHHRVVCWQHQNRGAELDARRDRCRVGERHERFGPAHAVEAVRGQEVVGDEQRLEAELLGVRGEPADLISVPLL